MSALEPLPAEIVCLSWYVDPAGVDRHVTTSWRRVAGSRWAGSGAYAPEVIADFTPQGSLLALREFAHWTVIAGTETPISRGRAPVPGPAMSVDLLPICSARGSAGIRWTGNEAQAPVTTASSL